MAIENTHLQSINLPGEVLCVDVLRRPDGSSGFDTFRRDPDGGQGWYCIGHFGTQGFLSADAALVGAKQRVAWLRDMLPD